MKVTDDKSYVTCSRLPIIMGQAHSMAQTRNEYLQEILSKQAGTFKEPPLNNYAKYTDYFEGILRDITKKEYGKGKGKGHLEYLNGYRTEPWISKDIPLGASCDDAFISRKPTKFISPLNEEFSFEGKILFEYKTTQVTSIDLPLYQGPIQVIGQMLCTGIRQAIIMRFNIRTWQIEYWPIVFDEKTADTIKAAVIDFWDHVKNKKFFPADRDGDYQIIFKQSKPVEIDLNGNNQMGAAVNDWKEGSELKKEGQNKIDVASMIIKEAMGEHQTAKFTNFTIEWPNRHFKAQPEKVVAAKAAHDTRQKTIKIKEAL